MPRSSWWDDWIQEVVSSSFLRDYWAYGNKKKKKKKKKKIIEIEKVFRVLECSEDEKVAYATYMLRGHAYD